MTQATEMDETKMIEFVGQAVGDVGAMLGGAMVVIGDKLGLYRAMKGAGSLTPAQLAASTGTAERHGMGRRPTARELLRHRRDRCPEASRPPMPS